MILAKNRLKILCLGFQDILMQIEGKWIADLRMVFHSRIHHEMA